MNVTFDIIGVAVVRRFDRIIVVACGRIDDADSAVVDDRTTANPLVRNELNRKLRNTCDAQNGRDTPRRDSRSMYVFCDDRNRDGVRCCAFDPPHPRPDSSAISIDLCRFSAEFDDRHVMIISAIIIQSIS